MLQRYDNLYIEQKNDTKNGTVKSTSIPCITDIDIKSFPEYRVITGRETSIEVTPAVQIGASLPKYLTRSGAPSKVNISRNTLVSNAIVPNSVAN